MTRLGTLDRPREVKARFGVETERVPEVLGLMGDVRDKIPVSKVLDEKPQSLRYSSFEIWKISTVISIDARQQSAWHSAPSEKLFKR